MCVYVDVSKVFVGTSVYTSLRNESVDEDNSRLRGDDERDEKQLTAEEMSIARSLREVTSSAHFSIDIETWTTSTSQNERDNLEKRHFSDVRCSFASEFDANNERNKTHTSVIDRSFRRSLSFDLQRQQRPVTSGTFLHSVFILICFLSSRLVNSKSNYLRINCAMYSWFTSCLSILSSWEEI